MKKSLYIAWASFHNDVNSFQAPDVSGVASFSVQEDNIGTMSLFVESSSPDTEATVDTVDVSGNGFDFDTSVSDGNGNLVDEDTENQVVVDGSGEQLLTTIVEVTTNNVKSLKFTNAPLPKWVRFNINIPFVASRLICDTKLDGSSACLSLKYYAGVELYNVII